MTAVCKGCGASGVRWIVEHGWCTSCHRLRDQFAAAALTGIISNDRMVEMVNTAHPKGDRVRMFAEMAFVIADEAMEARKGAK